MKCVCDAEAGARVGEAEVDPADEREHAQHDHRDQHRDQQEQRLAARELDARLAAGRARREQPAPLALDRAHPALASGGGADDEARVDADRLRRPRRILDPLEQQLGRDARALGRAEVDRGQRRPGELREGGVVHAHHRHVLRHVDMRIAQRHERARRDQVVGAEDRVGPRAPREQALGGTAAGLDHEVVGHDAQLLVALEPARAEAVEIAEAPRGARHGVLRPVD